MRGLCQSPSTILVSFVGSCIHLWGKSPIAPDPWFRDSLHQYNFSVRYAAMLFRGCRTNTAALYILYEQQMVACINFATSMLVLRWLHLIWSLFKTVVVPKYPSVFRYLHLLAPVRGNQLSQYRGSGGFPSHAGCQNGIEAGAMWWRAQGE